MNLLKESWKKDKLKWKIFLLILLCVAFVINLVIIGIQKSEKRKNREQIEKTEELSVPESGTSDSKENVVPDSGTKNLISNLEEYATPMMNEETYLLLESLSSFLKKQNLKEQEAEIIHVMIPEDAPDSVLFFIQLKEDDILLELSFEREKRTVSVNVCKYTREEILAEVWEGIEPENKDLPEEY